MTTPLLTDVALTDDEQRLSFIERARGIHSLIEEDADQIERDGKVTERVVAELRRLGLFWVGVPVQHGGTGGTVIDMIDVVEELASADASTGWITMVNTSAVSMTAGYMPDGGAEAMFRSGPRATMAGFAAPVGKGRRVDGGYLLTGQWPFASGSDWATWFGLGFTVVDDDGSPVPGVDGKPQALYATTPSDRAELIHTWDVTGLVGTGSNDIRAKDLFVPDENVMDAYSTTPIRGDVSYHLGKDGIAIAGHAAVALGTMKHALELVADIADGKQRRGYPVTVDQYPLFQYEFAKADATYRSARAYLFEQYREALDEARRDQQISQETRWRLRQAAVWATKVVDDVIAFARVWGATQAFRNPSTLGRVVRDAYVTTQHLHMDNIWLVDAGKSVYAETLLASHSHR